VVGDEINRASPKTQSALLECMEERQVTVDGVTYELEAPFMVIATQNPIEMEGTYPLPEAQRDRFTAGSRWATRSRRRDRDARPEIRKLVDIVGQVYVSEAVQRYAVAISTATRTHRS
jgi:MoxR-like ATPase